MALEALKAEIQQASDTKVDREYLKAVGRLVERIAMIKDAPNILLDEPTSGLDPKAASEFLKILKGLKEEGKAIFMSTHDIFRAKMVADRVGIMKEGRLVMLRTREEFMEEDLEKIYLDYMQEAG